VRNARIVVVDEHMVQSVMTAHWLARMGWEVHVLYATKIFFSIGGTTAWLENQTIAGFLARFGDDMYNMHLLKNPLISRRKGNSMLRKRQHKAYFPDPAVLLNEIRRYYLPTC